MSLWLDEGAVLKGDPDRNHYPLMPGMTKTTDGTGEYNLASWEGNPETSFASLISAISAEHVDIVGRGHIDGGGAEGDADRMASEHHLPEPLPSCTAPVHHGEEFPELDGASVLYRSYRCI